MKIDKSLILNAIKSYLDIAKDAEFARYLGIKPQTLASWHTRNTYDIDLLYAKCEFLNAEWLLTGKGEMVKNRIIDTAIVQKPSVEEFGWQARYEELNEKYIQVLEENNRLLKNKLKELLSDDKSA
ncbi:hypothetical protein HP439_13075 [Sphingobacterium shayense]|uniref:helix-turn-helix domain-containing protein n=1 Tax=Sphingobacterium shayense TaxID=626343 RepID=UPI001552A8DB|nr:helix-turn-helix domain-containing protein [Sphingobacterium shayense]NQD71655.1 hypothetical protein [Sphingobacterium shayense]